MPSVTQPTDGLGLKSKLFDSSFPAFGRYIPLLPCETKELAVVWVEGSSMGERDT